MVTKCPQYIILDSMAPVIPAPPSFRLVIPSEGAWPNTAELRKKLAGKYPIKSVRLVMKNPVEPGFPLVVFVKLYLVKEVFGPTLRQMVRDAYAFAKKQIAEKVKKKKAQEKKRKRTKRGGRNQ